MKYIMDLHTHTTVSGHAYSSLYENVMGAKKNGIEVLGITEHTNGMVGGADPIYFLNYRCIPREIEGVKLLMGAEINIMDYQGNIDVGHEVLKELDLVIASLHALCLENGTKEECTYAMIKAMENKAINIIGHPGDPQFPIDVEEVVNASIRTNTLLEINNSSLDPKGFRAGSIDYTKEILKQCMKKDMPVALGSDSHFFTAIGVFNFIEPILAEVGFPDELIVNTSFEKLKPFLTNK